MFENLVVAITVGKKPLGKKSYRFFMVMICLFFFFTREIKEKLKMMAHE